MGCPPGDLGTGRVTPEEIVIGEAAVRGASTPFFPVISGLVGSLVVWLSLTVFVAALRRRSA